MGTFSDKDIVDEIIANNGDDTEPGNPLHYVKIVEYTGYEGQTLWGAVYNREVELGMGNKYEIETEYVRNPRVIWRRK